MKKKTSMTILIAILFLVSLKSQNYKIHWEKGQDFPLNLSEVKAISCNNKIYVIGGRINNSTTDYSKNVNVDYVYEYDPESKTWAKKTNMPFNDYDVTLTTVNDNIYSVASKTAMYNPLTDKWEIKKTLEDGKAHL